MFKKILICLMFLIVATLSLSACTTNTAKQKTTILDTDLALLTIFTFDGNGEGELGLPNLGHSFLGVENISDETLTIGKTQLSPGESVTIGTWSIQEHFGVWYNVESVYIKTINKYDGRISITAGIDSASIEKMNTFILSHDYWTPTNNCSNFALNLWNTIAEENEELIKPFIYSPSKIAKALKNFEGYEVNKQIETINKMYYFDENTPKYFEMQV